MRVDIDSESGFCFGVTSAILRAEEELMHGPLYCLGDIVHNGQEVKRLEEMGLETIDYEQLRTLKHARVLLRAHGEPPLTYRIAKDNQTEIIDCTCPVVKKLQERIRTCYEEGSREQDHRQIVIFGKVGHAEVIGLCGQTNNTAIVIENSADISSLDLERPIYLFSQTTMSVDQFQTLRDTIQSHLSEGAVFHSYDTICRNVANRVAHLQEFARQHDAVLFVGGKKSSNAKVLYEHCKSVNPCTFFVESRSDVTTSLVMQMSPSDEPPSDWTVGICGATSTPQWLMSGVRSALLALL